MNFILVDAFGEKATQEFEQIIDIVKAFWEEMRIAPEKTQEVLETMNKGVYPIPESRVLELLQQAGFGNITRFYTGLWIGGWLATKN